MSYETGIKLQGCSAAVTSRTTGQMTVEQLSQAADRLGGVVDALEDKVQRIMCQCPPSNCVEKDQPWIPDYFDTIRQQTERVQYYTSRLETILSRIEL